jgi:peptidase E
MAKKTLFFSNIIGNVMIDDEDARFNDYMSEYLIKNIDSTYSLFFIEAPGLGGEEKYLPNILRCFNKIGIKFNSVIHIDEETLKSDIDSFYNDNSKIVYFLMGGNPYSQLEIIDNLNLRENLKNHDDLVIGFCAGAINLSKYSIITSDDDFDKPDSYYGIEREDICIEPHYNDINNEIRNKELKEFAKKYNTKIYCIPDESIIYFEDGTKNEKGRIYTII